MTAELSLWVGCLLAGALAVYLLFRLFGPRWGVGAALLLGAAALGGWYFIEPGRLARQQPKSDVSAAVTSADCARCHQRHYQSWHRTYHRTMTRDASPEYVQGAFADSVYQYQGLPTKMTRRGDEFFMRTVDPAWALNQASVGSGRVTEPPQFREFRVDRLVGSHWIQECLHRLPGGRYIRLPVLYHIGEKRWVHTSGAFLTPESKDFWAMSRWSAWNESCLYCHNTSPSKNPVRGPDGRLTGYETEVLELGIACAACHGQGVEHVRRHDGGVGNAAEDVVSPPQLPVPRRDEICARCHAALVPNASMWDRRTHRDPYTPGEELTRYNTFFWSEAEQAVLAGVRPASSKPTRPEPTDGRFWGDGTPLTTALEYNAMALSPCYQGGKGKLSCLTCHAMHGKEPNMLLRSGMQSNNACYGCHPAYQDQLSQHTKHPADSPGSLCYNCHMPYQVYSLMTTHRSHRIQTPHLAGSVGTGKPHACNLCHLDKPLGWTRDQLARWPGKKSPARPELGADQETVSAALLTLLQDDARSRAVVAGAFSRPEALRGSGRDWVGSQLTRLLEQERYPAVRYLLHRGLQGLNREAASGYDPLGLPALRGEQARLLRESFDATPVRRPVPGVPLTEQGLPDRKIFERLRRERKDPDVTVNE